MIRSFLTRAFAAVGSWFGQGDEPRIAVAAIFKNEAPYILEWIAFHQAVGVTRFFIADNDSDDGTAELLKALEQIGVVKFIAFPTLPGSPPQLPAYAEIMRQHRKEADWIAFIDADEFLVPTDGSVSILPVFRHLPANAGTVVVNWAVYGSSFRREPSTGLVIERFTHRAEENDPKNCHYKSIVRSTAFHSPHLNPHMFKIGYWYGNIHADCSPVVDHPVHGAGLSERVHWFPLRLNHYVVKSKAEFDQKKAPRGRAMKLGERRPVRFFHAHDRNEVSDPVSTRLVELTKGNVEQLRAALRANGCGEDLVMLDETIAGLIPAPEPGHGLIDRVDVGDDAVSIIGWALSGENRRVGTLSLSINDHPVETTEERLVRRDVARKFVSTDVSAGFRLTFPREMLVQVSGSSPTVRFLIECDSSALKIQREMALKELLGPVDVVPPSDAFNDNGAVTQSKSQD